MKRRSPPRFLKAFSDRRGSQPYEAKQNLDMTDSDRLFKNAPGDDNDAEGALSEDFDALEREVFGEDFTPPAPAAGKAEARPGAPPPQAPTPKPPASPRPEAAKENLLDALNEEMLRWESEVTRRSPASPRQPLHTAPGVAARHKPAPPRPVPAQQAPAAKAAAPRPKPPAPSFPPLHVYLYDPNPLIRNALEEEFRGTRIGATVCRSPAEFIVAMTGSRPHREFAVVLLGADVEVNTSFERLAELRLAYPHAIILFMSELSLSTVRRRAFESGAWGFLEKPAAPGPGRPWDPSSMARFRQEALRAVEDLYQRHKVYFDAVIEGLSGQV